MKKLLIFVLFCGCSAFGQEGFYQGQVTTINQSAPLPNALYPMLALPGASVAICNYPATGYSSVSNCTNYATTYTSVTGGTACPSTAQVVWANSSTCESDADTTGSFNVWITGGHYQYTTCASYGCFGPYDFMAQTASPAPFPVVNGQNYGMDPTFTNNSTTAFGSAIAAVTNATGGTLFIPHGHYLVCGPITISNATNLQIYGEGRATILDTTGCSGQSGVAALLFSADFAPYVHDLQIVNGSGSTMHAAIEFYVPGGFTTESTQAIVENVKISGSTSSRFTYGISWEHATTGCGSGGTHTCDDNNDQAVILKSNINNIGTAAYYITGGNSIWHNFYDDDLGGDVPEGFLVLGGAFTSKGLRSAACSAMSDFETPSSGDADFSRGSVIDGAWWEPSSSCSASQPRPVMQTAAGDGPPSFTLSNAANIAWGDNSSTDPLANYQSGPTGATTRVTLNLIGNHLNSSNGGVVTVTPANSTLNLVANEGLGITTINYGGTFVAWGNAHQSGAYPTLNFTGSNQSLCQIGDRVGNGTQIVTPTCLNFAISGNGAVGTSIAPSVLFYIQPPSGTGATIAEAIDVANLVNGNTAWELKTGTTIYKRFALTGSGVIGQELNENSLETFWESGNGSGITASVNGANGQAQLTSLAQAAPKSFAYTCAMASGTTCTVPPTGSLSATFTSTPGCIAINQSSDGIAGSCTVGGSSGAYTIAVKAGTSNSDTWLGMLVGLPN